MRPTLRSRYLRLSAGFTPEELIAETKIPTVSLARQRLRFRRNGMKRRRDLTMWKGLVPHYVAPIAAQRRLPHLSAPAPAFLRYVRSDPNGERPDRRLASVPKGTRQPDCEQAGSYVPRYCYHRNSPFYNCRMCLIEMGMPKMGSDRKPILDAEGRPKSIGCRVRRFAARPMFPKGSECAPTPRWLRNAAAG